MTTALAPEVQALLSIARVPQRDKVLMVQEARRSSGTAPHRVRRLGEGRGTRRQQRGRAISESLRG